MKIFLIHLLVVLALTFGVSEPAVADKGNSAFKLEGAWVAKALPPFVGQWSYVVSSDPSGKRGTGHGTVDVGFRANYVCNLHGFPTEFETSDTRSPILVSMVMTAPDTIAYTAVWYGLKDLGPMSPITDSIVLIGTVSGELKVMAPNKLQGTHNFALYYPGADVDRDGFPDEDMAPECLFQLNTVDTRLPGPE